ncbi:hypothetical protein GY45DRAFT_321333 [Cubamyces sp. BRFM 1775]|nr:hypothetical protein GY45DRAFT_321333 [Cubamyces sp. BRFM 1775]
MCMLAIEPAGDPSTLANEIERTGTASQPGSDIMVTDSTKSRPQAFTSTNQAATTAQAPQTSTSHTASLALPTTPSVLIVPSPISSLSTTSCLHGDTTVTRMSPGWSIAPSGTMRPSTIAIVSISVAIGLTVLVCLVCGFLAFARTRCSRHPFHFNHHSTGRGDSRGGKDVPHSTNGNKLDLDPAVALVDASLESGDNLTALLPAWVFDISAPVPHDHPYEPRVASEDKQDAQSSSYRRDPSFIVQKSNRGSNEVPSPLPTNPPSTIAHAKLRALWIFVAPMRHGDTAGDSSARHELCENLQLETVAVDVEAPTIQGIELAHGSDIVIAPQAYPETHGYSMEYFLARRLLHASESSDDQPPLALYG